MAKFRQISGHWIYCPTINNESVVIDLGANRAEFSRQIYKEYNAHCFAIEPNQDLFNEIEDLNIEKYKYAITKENGFINFYINNNNEASSLIKNFESNWGEKRIDLIEGVTWNSLVERLKLKSRIVSILKVDIEGAELDLIESLTIDNISSVEQITIEFHDWLNESLHERTVSAIKKLISLRFIAISNTPDHSWPVEMLFLNQNLTRFNFFQKLLLRIYNKLTFLKY